MKKRKPRNRVKFIFFIYGENMLEIYFNTPEGKQMWFGSLPINTLFEIESLRSALKNFKKENKFYSHGYVCLLGADAILDLINAIHNQQNSNFCSLNNKVDALKEEIEEYILHRELTSDS
jgi:hypothetical protein